MKNNIWVERAEGRLRRRLFLKATVGLGIAAPLAARLTRDALAQAAGSRPKRILFFYYPHGVPPEHYNPQGSGTDFDLNQTGVSILGPLQEYKSLVNVFQGIKYPGAQTHEGILTILSGLGDGKTADEMTARTTVDQVIGKGLGVKPLLLGAIPHRQWGLDKDGKIWWDAQPVVAEKNPINAYDSVFATLGSGTPTQPSGTDPNVELSQALTALTRSEVTQLRDELASLTREKTRLQIHLDALANRPTPGAGGGGSGGPAVSCSAKPTIAALESLRTKAQGGGDDFFVKEENFPDIYAAQLGIAAQAILCNAAPVVGVQALYTNIDIDFKFMGTAGSHHNSLSHTGPSAQGTGLDPATRTPFAKAQRWFYEQLVTHVLSVFNQTDPADPAHKVIDNTIIYCFSEIGEAAWHKSETAPIQLGGTPNAISYLPLLTIGGGGGAIKTGNLFKFGTDRPAGDIYLALCRAMGVSNAMFPNTTGPLMELLT